MQSLDGDVLIKKYLESPTTVTIYLDAHLSDTHASETWTLLAADVKSDTSCLPHEVSTADSPHSLAGSRSQ